MDPDIQTREKKLFKGQGLKLFEQLFRGAGAQQPAIGTRAEPPTQKILYYGNMNSLRKL